MPVPNARTEHTSRSIALVVSVLLTGAFLALLWSRSVLVTADGGLDPSFGTAGRVFVDFSGQQDVGIAGLLQSDGRIVVVGSSADFKLARLLPDGSLDPTYGTGGRATADLGGTIDSARAAAIQPDGQVVVAGTIIPGVTGWDFGVARFTITGALDSAFGSGGKVTTDFGLGDDDAESIAIQPDGKIIVAGRTGTVGAGKFALARYCPNGSLDNGSNCGATGFGSAGLVTTSVGSEAIAHSVKVQPDGRIVAAGGTQPGNDFALVRYCGNGLLDDGVNCGAGGFGVGGIVTTDLGAIAHIEAIVIQDDGTILAGGDIGQNFALARYLPSGSLDATFGINGVVTTDLGGNELVRKLRLQSDGKVVATGESDSGGNWNFWLARYYRHGVLDTSFGTNGRISTDFSGTDIVEDLLVQPDGKLIAIGNSTGQGTQDFALARFTVSQTVTTHLWSELVLAGGPTLGQDNSASDGVFDEANNRLIFFSGNSANGIPPFPTDTWVLSGADGVFGTPGWIKLTTLNTPAGRRGHAAAYDPVANVLMMHGGCLGGCFPLESGVHILTNANGIGLTPTWSSLATSGGPPQSRNSHSVSYDPNSNRLILFGGDNGSGGKFNDVWVLSNANGQGGSAVWTQLPTTGGPPSGRNGVVAALDPVANRLIVHGGNANSAFFTDTWVLSNANGLGGTAVWTQLSPLGSIPNVRDSSGVYDRAENALYLFGGQLPSTALTNEIWRLSHANGLGGTPVWSKVQVVGGQIPVRSGPLAGFRPVTKRLTLFGGWGGANHITDTWTIGLAPPLVTPADGDIVFTGQPSGNQDIERIGPDGSGRRRLTTDTASDSSPRWSPDGTQIVFSSSRDSGNVNVYRMNADGTGQAPLTSDPASDGEPAWAPGGQEIAFASNRAGSAGLDIYRMNISGTVVTHVINVAGVDTLPVYSSDGTGIAFTTDRDGAGDEIYTANLDGSGQTRLTTLTGRAPDWSPDGSRLVFDSQRDGNSEIYRMYPNGANQTRLTASAGSDEKAVWSADGSRILFASHRDGRSELYLMFADGSSQTRLTYSAAPGSTLPHWRVPAVPLTTTTPTITPTPTWTPTPTPSATSTVTPTATNTVTPTATVAGAPATNTPTPTATGLPGSEPSPTMVPPTATGTPGNRFSTVYIPNSLAPPPSAPPTPPTPPTPTPTQVPPLRDGDFGQFAAWTVSNGGLGASFVFTSPINGSPAALLGSPALVCGRLPVNGYGQITQRFVVPDLADVALRFDWRLLTQDVERTASGGLLGDTFDVYLVESSAAAPPTGVLADGDRLFRRGGPTRVVNDCREPFQTLSGSERLDLTGKRGRTVWLVFQMWNRLDENLNSYAYLDNVRIESTLLGR